MVSIGFMHSSHPKSQKISSRGSEWEGNFLRAMLNFGAVFVPSWEIFLNNSQLLPNGSTQIFFHFVGQRSSENNTSSPHVATQTDQKGGWIPWSLACPSHSRRATVATKILANYYNLPRSYIIHHHWHYHHRYDCLYQFVWFCVHCCYVWYHVLVYTSTVNMFLEEPHGVARCLHHPQYKLSRIKRIPSQRGTAVKNRSSAGHPPLTLRKTLAETKKKTADIQKTSKHLQHPWISDSDRRGAVNNKTHLQFFTPGVPSFPFAHLIHSPSEKDQEQGQKVPYPLETPHTNIKQKGDPWQRRARSFQQLKSCQCCWIWIIRIWKIYNTCCSIHSVGCLFPCFGFKNVSFLRWILPVWNKLKAFSPVFPFRTSQVFDWLHLHPSDPEGKKTNKQTNPSRCPYCIDVPFEIGRIWTNLA